MKSAYELAMERLEKEAGPTQKLDDASRDALAEIEKRYDAKIAEVSLKLSTNVTEDPQESEQLRQHLNAEIASLEAKREQEKQAIWDSHA